MRRADPHRALLRALIGRYPELVIVESETKSWASVTFTGTRHILTCKGAADLAGIEEADFKLPGHFVADVAVERSNGRTLIEALTVESA